MAKPKPMTDPAKAREALIAAGQAADAVAALSDEAALEAANKAAEAPKEDPAPANTVKVKKIGGASFGYGSQSYEADAKGVIIIPVEALSDALSHGFERV